MSKPRTHDEYLAALPPVQRDALARVRAQIRALLPDAEEVISYAMPAFKRGEVVIGYAAFSRHLAVYPFSGSVIPRLQDELAGFTTSKSGVQFTPDRPLSEEQLEAIIAARLAEIG